MEDKFEIKKFTTVNFLNFALGFLGLQFAWQMRIILSAPVTEGLGADPFIYGLIWLAGPFTGMVVQPLIGALSDKTKSRFGRRRPYLLGGAIIASIALWLFPNSGDIVNSIANENCFRVSNVNSCSICYGGISIYTCNDMDLLNNKRKKHS